MSEKLIIFSPLFYIWSLFIAKKLRLLESIYQEAQRRSEERRGEEWKGEERQELSWALASPGKDCSRKSGLQVGDLFFFLRKWDLTIGFICMPVISGGGGSTEC